MSLHVLNIRECRNCGVWIFVGTSDTKKKVLQLREGDELEVVRVTISRCEECKKLIKDPRTFKKDKPDGTFGFHS